LVEEHDVSGTISIRNFFGRRIVRLAPALGFFLLCWFAVDLAFGAHGWMTTVPGGGSGGGVSATVALEGIAGAFGYLTNWLTIGNLFSGYVPLGHLWSLAVEEQIYLIWTPILALLLAYSKRLASWVSSALVLASLLEASVLLAQHESLRVYMGTDTRAGAFLFGGMLAIARSRGVFVRIARGVTPDLVVVASLAALAWCFHPLSDSAFTSSTLLAWVTATVAGATLVLGVTLRRGWFARLISVGLLTYIGRRSYALYLWHYVWLTWLRAMGHTGAFVAFLASLACAEISWRLVEKLALRQRHRFAPPTLVATSVIPTSTAATAIAEVALG
jgi:peptidoglycan/LPS O-acetylase OafA/YrhL